MSEKGRKCGKEKSQKKGGKKGEVKVISILDPANPSLRFLLHTLWLSQAGLDGTKQNIEGDICKDTAQEELTGDDHYSKEEAGVRGEAGMSSLREKDKEDPRVERVKLREHLIWGQNEECVVS